MLAQTPMATTTPPSNSRSPMTAAPPITFNVTPADNSTPNISIQTNTITFNVTPVNDAPAGTVVDKTITLLEDAQIITHTFSSLSAFTTSVS